MYRILGSIAVVAVLAAAAFFLSEPNSSTQSSTLSSPVNSDDQVMKGLKIN